MATPTAFSKVVDSSVAVLRDNESVKKILPMLGPKGEKLVELGEEAQNASRYLGMLPPGLMSFGGWEENGMGLGTILKSGGDLVAAINGDATAQKRFAHDVVFGSASTALGALKSHNQMFAALDIMGNPKEGSYSAPLIEKFTASLLGEADSVPSSTLVTPKAPVITTQNAATPETPARNS